MFDNIIADLKRFGVDDTLSWRPALRGVLSQGFQAILVYRFFNWLHKSGLPGQPLRFFVERFIEITTGISIPAECMIGKGFRIHHFGGIMFHPAVVIGENCTICQDVTLGDKGGYGGAPIIGDNVFIGAGAKILGGVKIGNNSKIGALVVVSESIQNNSKVLSTKPVVLTGTDKTTQ